MLLNGAKCKCFYHLWVIRGKPTGGGGEINHPHMIRVNQFCGSNECQIQICQNYLYVSEVPQMRMFIFVLFCFFSLFYNRRWIIFFAH